MASPTADNNIKIGVLGLQGAVAEHVKALSACGVETSIVKRAEQLEGLKGLVIPGGESTTVGKLLEIYGLDKAIIDAVGNGMGLFGTCTGLILMAKDIDGSGQPRLGIMDICAKRNAYGRQVDSFEADIPIPSVGSEPFRTIFIRAPYIDRVWGKAEALAYENDKIILAKQDKMLAAAFHPELTNDLRVHKLFLSMVI